jgi:hypothetical protein
MVSAKPSGKEQDNMATNSGLERGIYVFHEAGDGSHQMYYSFFDGNLWYGDSLVPGGRATEDGPALVWHNGRIYLFHRGPPGDANLYYTSWDGQNWAGQRAIAAASWRPSAVVWNGLIYVFYHGATSESDNQIHYLMLDGDSEWSTEQTIPGALAWHAPSVVVYNSLITCFHQGYDSVNQAGDAQLWANWLYPDGHWYGETRVAVPAISEGPSAVVEILSSAETLHCLYQGSGSNGNLLLHSSLDPSGSWVTEPPVPDVWLTNGPGACVFNKRIYCFHQGHNNELWCQVRVGRQWLERNVHIDPPAWLWWSPGAVAIGDSQSG